MRRNVIAFLAFLVVVGGGYLAFRSMYHYHGYSGLEEPAVRLYFVARIMSEAEPYHEGAIIILEQKYAVGDNFAVVIAQRPLPVLQWSGGAWRGIPNAPGKNEPARVEQRAITPLSAIAIRAARVENERIPYAAMPPIREKPMSHRPLAGEEVMDSARFAYVHIAAGAEYISLSIEEKAAKDAKPYELDYVYWVESDGSMQCRKGQRRVVFNG